MSSRSVQLIGDNRKVAGITASGRLKVEQTFAGFGDGGAIDAFGRLRVSNPEGLFESTLTNDKQPLLWNESLTGDATSTHKPLESAVDMTVETDEDLAIRQTKQYFRYQPGKSQLILATFAFGDGDANVRKRIGYFDGDNGIFLEEIDGALWVVLRSKVSGSVVDTRIAQANWNLDVYNELDPTKAQILMIDMEWLGVGRVRVGFVEDGVVRYVHQFQNSNVNDTVYMTTAQLPVRVEMEATGAPSGTVTMKQICASVTSEGGQEVSRGFPFAVTTDVSSFVTASSRIPVLSTRPKATFNGIVNRISTINRLVEVYNNSNGALVEVVYNGTLTGPSWVSVNDESVMEYDISASAISGGITILSFFVFTQNGGLSRVSEKITGRLPLALDIDGTNPTNLSIVVSPVSGNANVVASLNWQEYR